MISKLWVLASNLQRFQLRGEIFVSQDWSGSLLRSDTSRVQRANGKGRSFLHVVVYFAFLYPTLDLMVMTGSKWQAVKRGYPWPVEQWVASRSWDAEYGCSSAGKDPEAVGTAERWYRGGACLGRHDLSLWLGLRNRVRCRGLGWGPFPSPVEQFAFFSLHWDLIRGFGGIH